ncbi:MAG: hypothetical protein EXS68_00460 [Candidatus Ryanbacteria bacterium]|nr:hypothetical protein [Candidatus Ryanbacteria bacterium]
MDLDRECNYDHREFRTTEYIPVTASPCMLFSNDSGVNAGLIARFTGDRWAQFLASILAIEGVGAIEVHQFMVIVYKRADIPWDYVSPAVEKLLGT